MQISKLFFEELQSHAQQNSSKNVKNDKGEPCDLPEDRMVKENPRNGFLTVSKKDKVATA